jgi:hypothetical protein
VLPTELCRVIVSNNKWSNNTKFEGESTLDIPLQVLGCMSSHEAIFVDHSSKLLWLLKH